MKNNQEIKKIRSDAFAHGSCDKNGNIKHYVSFWGDKKEITLEEKEKALNEYNNLKKEKIQSISTGDLVFVGMGMEKEGEIDNHRFRTKILRSDGRRFFVEFTTGKEGHLFVDCPTDLDEKSRYENNYRTARELYKGKEHTTEAREELKKRSAQPYFHYKEEQIREFLRDKEPTKKLVLDCINTHFGTNFESMEIDQHLLDQDDFWSISKK